MKILLSWLNDYVDTGGLSAEKVAGILSNIGFPTEGIEQIGPDSVIDIEVTSNRGDCLGYIGIARELAAATGKELKIPTVELDESKKDVAEFTDVEITEPDLCHRYTARVIEDVKVGPAPDWMVKRLQAVGMRSVNNVVDATNYAMLETGQPPHAFDYEKISKGKIIVRKAAPGERIVSIGGSKCDLGPDMLIIADAKKPVAVAGVMGGLDTEVSDSTATILLEDAYFDPVTVRTTSRKLALLSEASFRFERIVDAENVDWASRRTAQLITQAAGGKVAKGVVDIYPKKLKTKQVTLRLSRLNKLLGIEVPDHDAIRILDRLCFQPKRDGDIITCSVPSWRSSDIYREADLVEEVARVYGYDKIPIEKKISIEVVPQNDRRKVTEQITTYLNGCGYYETINVTFTDDIAAQLFTTHGPENHLAVKDVSRKTANLLRQTLLCSLFAVLKTNLNAANTPCRIFELADTFIPAGTDEHLPLEGTKLAIVSDGQLRELRGAVEGLIKTINRDLEVEFAPIELPWADPGAQVIAAGHAVGVAGVVNENVCEKFDFDGLAPCGAELDLNCLMALQKGPVQVKPIPKYPSIVRDLSLLIDEQIPWADVTEAVNRSRPDELEDICFVGIYRGKGIDAGKKSLTLSLRFRDTDGTLTHEKVDSLEAGIVKNITSSTGAVLRTI